MDSVQQGQPPMSSRTNIFNTLTQSKNAAIIGKHDYPMSKNISQTQIREKDINVEGLQKIKLTQSRQLVPTNYQYQSQAIL